MHFLDDNDDNDEFLLSKWTEAQFMLQSKATRKLS